MNGIPDKIRDICQAALMVGFTGREIKQYVREHWPEADAVVTLAMLTVWKRQIVRMKAAQ